MLIQSWKDMIFVDPPSLDDLPAMVKRTLKEDGSWEVTVVTEEEYEAWRKELLETPLP